MRKLTSHLYLILCFSALLLSSCEYLPLSLPTTDPTLTPTVIAQPDSTPTVTPKAVMPTGPYAPVVLGHIPANGQAVSPDTEITLYFDQSMDRDSVSAAFQLSPPTDGDLVWRDDSTMVFRPKALSSAMRYQVTLAPEALSGEGLPLSSEVAFAFSVAPFLEVTQISPQDMAQEVRADEPLFIAFNHAVVEPNCVGQLAQADCPALPLTFSPAVLGDGLWVNTSVYRFDPLPGWAAGVTYQVMLDTDIYSVDGAELPDIVDSSFTTALPSILETAPGNNAPNVSLNAKVRISFNTPMDQEITASVFSVRTASGDIVPGTLTWADDGAQLLFTPTQSFALATRYIVQIGGRARAITSAPLQNPQSFVFETVPYPAVAAFVPSSNAELDVFAPVQIAFLGEIDPQTLENQISIEPFPETSQLHTYFEASTATYYLAWEKQPQTEYCVTVSPGVADIYGNTIEAPQTSCFTTEDYEPFIDLATDMAAQTIDAESEPTAHFLVRNLGSVDFKLLALDEVSFIKSPRNVSGTELRAWTERFSPGLNQTSVAPVVLTRRGDPLPTGYYHLQWETPNWGNRGVNIAVVDYHVTLKLAPEQALVWVTDLQTGRPITRTTVNLVDPEGALIAGGTTNDAGLVNIPIEQRENLWDKVAAIVGEPGADGFGLAVTGWTAEATPWNSDIDVAYGHTLPFDLFLHTDRPLYHPGQIVNFGGVLRSMQDVAYTLPPADTALSLSLNDALGNVAYSSTIMLTEWGTFDGAILLSDTALVGEYQLRAELSDYAQLPLQTLSFSVNPYSQPEFDVSAVSETENYAHGETIRALIRANYTFGEAVVDAPVQWRVFADSTSSDSAQSILDGAIIAEGTGTTNIDGQFVLELPANSTTLPTLDNQTQRWVIEVTLFDTMGDAVSASSIIFVHPAKVAVDMSLEAQATIADTRIPVVVQVQDWQQSPVADHAATVKMALRQWYEVAPLSPLDTPTWVYTDTVVSTEDVSTDASGLAETVIRPTEGGLYIVSVETADAEGRVVRAESELWVSGDSVIVGPETSNVVLPVADAKRYQIGDTANILLPTPFEGAYQVLMTVEREGIFDVAHFDFDTPNPLIELPIVEAYAPNVYVSFVATQAVTDAVPVPEVRSGYVPLWVEPTSQILSVALSPDKMTLYEPGDTAVLTVQTSDAEGVPVDANVRLVAIDKHKSTLSHTHLPSIVNTLYGVHPLRVITGDSLMVLLDRLAQQLEQIASVAERRVAQATLGDLAERHAQESVSMVSDSFSAPALWVTDLQTGESGEIQAEFVLPDVLTTWSVRAYAITEDSKVGEAEAEIQVQQPLVIVPDVPRFFIAGDRPQVSAVVYNNTAQDLDVGVEVLPEGAGVVGDASHVAAIPAGRHARMVWTLDIPLTAGETIAIDFSAMAGGYKTTTQAVSDENASGIAVYRYYVPDVGTVAGVLDTDESIVEPLFIPSDIGTGSAVVVQVDTSLLSVMSANLDYLARYPYASTDALVNRFLPSLVVPSQLIEMRTSETIVFDSLERLYARQNPDGGWGWWQDESNLQLTSYVVLGLLQSRASGYAVREDVITQALSYVQMTLRLSLQAGTRYAYHAFALYTLSVADYAWPDGAVAALYTARESLSVTGRAYLASALGRVDASDTRIVTLLNSLRENVKVTVSGAHWDAASVRYWETDVLATAVIVDALAHYAPDDVLLPQAVAWLLEARQSEHWPTSYETAWTVMALASYAQTTEMTANYAWSATLHNSSLVEDERASTASWRTYLPLDGPNAFSLLKGEVNVLKLMREDGSGLLYYMAQPKLVVPVADVAPESRGLLVRREYCVPVKSGANRPDVCQSLRQVALGDDLEVRLTLVVPQTRHFVTLEDVYPAAFEPASEALLVNPVIVTQPLTDTEAVGTQYTWWWGNPFDHWELRDDRAVFFARELLPGTYQVSYTLRAVHSGVYQALPAIAEQTYFPEVWGRSSGNVIEVLAPVLP